MCIARILLLEPQQLQAARKDREVFSVFLLILIAHVMQQENLVADLEWFLLQMIDHITYSKFYQILYYCHARSNS